MNFAAIFIAFLVLVLSLTVHEAAHALTADRLGDPTARLLGRLSLNPAVHIDPIGTILFPLISMFTGAPLIGWAKPVPVSPNRLGRHWKRKFMVIAAAGPASNIVIAVVAALLLRVVPVSGSLGEATLAPLAVFLYRMVGLNVLLAVFNMIPVPPLDGGNVMAGVLRGPVAEAYDRLRPYGFLILYALILTGMLGRIVIPAADAVESLLL
ncbi:MAG: site-2 protease family protein [Acidobacteria bacterium]|nr:MAG: site-2 protease family protein [Acidobacteriota bacterium]